MRKLRVRRQLLSGVGELFELETSSGLTVVVVAHRSGRRQIALRAGDAERPAASTTLTRTEALAIAALLSGTHIELVTVSVP